MTAQGASTSDDASVLVVMDLQESALDTVPGAAQALAAAVQAVRAARAGGIGVIFVRLGYPLGMPEIAETTPVFGALRDREQRLREDAWFTKVHPLFESRSDEPVVTRYRIGAYTASDPRPLISAAGAHCIVPAGVITSGVVLSTFLQQSRPSTSPVGHSPPRRVQRP